MGLDVGLLSFPWPRAISFFVFSLFYFLYIYEYIHILETCVPYKSMFLGPQSRFLAVQGFGTGQILTSLTWPGPGP
jgi:hypothetical protein